MIENYLTGFVWVWVLMGRIDAVRLGMERCGLYYAEPPETLNNVTPSGGRRAGNTLAVLWEIYPYEGIYVRSAQWVLRCCNPGGADAELIVEAYAYTLRPEDVGFFVFCELKGVRIKDGTLFELPSACSNVSMRVIK